MKIQFTDNLKPVKSFLYSTTDSSIIVTSSTDQTDLLLGHVTATEYAYSIIEKLSIWKHRRGIKTAVKVGSIVGGALGGLTFFMFALAGNSAEVGSPFLYGIAGGLIGFVLGFITGGLLGLVRMPIYIHGSESAFNTCRPVINQYAYRKE